MPASQAVGRMQRKQLEDGLAHRQVPGVLGVTGRPVQLEGEKGAVWEEETARGYRGAPRIL